MALITSETENSTHFSNQQSRRKRLGKCLIDLRNPTSLVEWFGQIQLRETWVGSFVLAMKNSLRTEDPNEGQSHEASAFSGFERLHQILGWEF